MAESSNEHPPFGDDDQDAVRLMLAFYCILEPEKRAELLALAERYASQSEVVDNLGALRREPENQ
jgi:hypothetical protein